MVTLPNGVLINNLIKDLRIYSWEAADILLNYSEKIKDFDYKRDFLRSLDHNDPVTEADLKVNESIIQNIQNNYLEANWKILSEENVKIASDIQNYNTDWLWVLDPLDGTKDFIQGTKNYAMHLALNYKQKAYIGLVLIPEKNELWISDGKKTWCETRDKSFKKTLLPLKKSLNEMVIVTSKNHKNETLQRLIENINFKEVITMGSIGCKIVSILRGESDIYISLSLPGQSSPKDWDFAAPEAILKAAGGGITNLDNLDLSYGKSKYEKGGFIIASNNRENHENLCLQIKEIIKKTNIIF